MNRTALIERFFDIQVKFGDTNYTFTIHPANTESQAIFIVELDGIDIGELELEDSVWKWKEGRFDIISASDIGYCIEAHYD